MLRWRVLRGMGNGMVVRERWHLAATLLPPNLTVRNAAGCLVAAEGLRVGRPEGRAAKR
jgi:hypothetical protein